MLGVIGFIFFFFSFCKEKEVMGLFKLVLYVFHERVTLLMYSVGVDIQLG